MALQDLIGAAKGHRETFTLWPWSWQQYRHGVLPSPAWTVKRLTSTEQKSIPKDAGVYSLIIRPLIADHPHGSFLMYVGQAVNLRERFHEYLTSERKEPGRPKLIYGLTTYSDYLWFCYITVPRQQLTAVEAELMNAFVPPWNAKYQGEISKIVSAF